MGDNTDQLVEQFDKSQNKLKMNAMFSAMTDIDLNTVPIHNRAYAYYRSYVPYVHRKYTKEQILNFMKSPDTCYPQLRDASVYLYSTSPQYRRVVNYFAHMCPMDYIIHPFKFDPTKEMNEKEKDKFKKAYKKVCDYMEIFNLQHEMRKVLVTAWREDLFAGYIYQTKDSLYIRRLPPDYVKIASIVDGCFMIAFDFTYFDTRLDELESYGPEFIEKYNLYKEGLKMTPAMNYRWQVLNEKKQFNIKISEDILYPLIPLLGCFPGIFDIEDYKDLSKGATVLRNYKALGIEIPTDDKGNFLMDKGLIDDFYQNLCNITPPNIGVFETPCPVKQYDFERSSTDDPDKTYEAIRNFYNDIGVSSLIFGSDKQTAASLKISITADATLCYAVNRQIERNVNRLLKTNFTGEYKFQITILDVSEFDKRQTHDMFLKDAQYGVPVKSAISATLGISQPVFNSMLYMENDFLDLQDNMIPLKSSYTQSSDSEGGRPTAEDTGDDISDSNEKTREADSNASRE